MKISSRVRLKLLAKRPSVTEEEIEECFASREGVFLEDVRAKNVTVPPTQWFVAETDMGRRLKVAFIYDGDIVIKTAYDADPEEISIYSKYAM